jgi:hypothetical protein
LGILTVCKLKQRSKALLPTDATPSGILTDDKLRQS